MKENKKLCIVVPYRDRAAHLAEFLPHIHKTLDAQHIDYHILIVEQTFDKPFNRAKLLNIGFHHTNGSYDYYCFHDVDMLPQISDYSYCASPTHLAAKAEQFGYKLPYEGYFGGVTIFNKESFEKINGYSNEYWGWGAEDDDVFNRCKIMNVQTLRKQCTYRSLAHGRNIVQSEYNENIHKLNQFNSSYDANGFKEGLSTLFYTVLDTTVIDTFTTKIIVEL
jgi:hypothetical protein